MAKLLKCNDLQFLDFITSDRTLQYREAIWLENNYNDDVWHCKFEAYTEFNLDFRVKLDDGSLLTSPKNHQLAETIKSLLCVQTHFDATGGKLLSPATSYACVVCAINLADYFLINSSYFQLGQHGLTLVTGNDIKQLIHKLASNKDISTSIYQWPERLEAFLRDQILTLEKKDVAIALTANPSLAKTIPEDDDRLLQLNELETVWARAWLWLNGFYKATSVEKDFRFIPKVQRLTKLIYKDTLWGRMRKPIPTELLVEPMERYTREYKKIPTRNLDDQRTGITRLSFFLRILRRLGLLHEIGLDVPVTALQTLATDNLTKFLDLKSNYRTRTLPHTVVLPSLRSALEFSLKYGDEIISSVLCVISKARQSGVCCQTLATTEGLKGLVSEKLLAAGVKTWSLKQSMSIFESNPKGRLGVRPDKEQYFCRLRSNEGLLELLKILYGSIAIALGTLMARRQGELTDLVATKCLDKTRTKLLFFNRKSGAFSIRNREARPVPPVVVRLITLIERLQNGLSEIGVISKPTYLFSYPNPKGDRLVAMYASDYNGLLDIFCDYVQTQSNDAGQRFYIRQHQLRRFFAMLFFWGESFGGMDTLRWFLGHTDIEHLYHYITESTTGEVLRSIKIAYASDKLLTESPDATELADVLRQKYGTTLFSVLDSDELDQYIEELLVDGKLTIEPEFFEAQDGKSYRIFIRATKLI